MSRQITFLLILSLSLCSGVALAETVAYPVDAPIFSICFPEGWNTNVEQETNVATSYSPSEDFAFILRVVRGEEGIEATLDMIDVSIQEYLTALKVGEPCEKTWHEMPCLVFEGKGTDNASGKSVGVAINLLTPDDGETFCVILCFGSEDAWKSYKHEIETTIDSMTCL